MPHSGGGGSSSGGFHSSSSFSAGSTQSRNLDSQRTSTSYFPGAYTFLYYSHGKPYYKYANYDLEKQERDNKIGSIALCIIATIVCGLISFFLITNSINKDVYKVDNTDKLSVLIKDNQGLLDTEKLSTSLQNIKDDTGAVFSVLTTNNSEWDNKFDNLEEYAYEYYLDSFEDEYHYLIVYSITNNDQTNWAFETMVGDRYVDYIDSDTEEEFSKDLYNDLKNGKDLTTAIIDNCESLSIEMVEGAENNSKFESIIGSVFALLGSIAFAGAIAATIYYKKKPKLVKIDENETKPIKCPYCGEQLLTNKFKRCPFCKQRLDE